jgi:hypothetical protein
MEDGEGGPDIFDYNIRNPQILAAEPAVYWPAVDRLRSK